jgi:hypothetical protein
MPFGFMAPMAGLFNSFPMFAPALMPLMTTMFMPPSILDPRMMSYPCPPPPPVPPPPPRPQPAPQPQAQPQPAQGCFTD